MKILDRYLYRELLSPFALGILLFTFLLLIDKIFDLTDLIINKGVPFPLVAFLLVYILPAFLVLTIPMALLLAILIAFGRMSGDLEIVALKASGVSPLRLLRPVVLFSAAAGLITAFLITEAMPWGNYAFKSLIFDILRTQASVGIKERVFNDTFGSFVIYVEEMSASRSALRGVFVADERRPEESRVILAREGRLISDEANRRITLRLLDGTIHEMDPKVLQKYRQVAFRLYDLSLTLENPLVRAGEAPKGDREMTLAELHDQAEALRRSGGNPNPYLVEIHKKYAIPTACLVFAVIGLPLGIRSHRGGRWAAFVVSLPIILLYYIFLTTGESLGDGGRIPPWLAMWGPNLLVGGIGLGLLWASVREASLPFTAPLDRLAALVYRALARPRPRRPAPARPAVGRAGRARVVRRRRRVRRQSRHIVDRYLVREFITYFGFGLALTASIIVIGDLMVTLDRYLRLKTPLSAILEHFAYRTPPYVYQGLHIVVLMSTILLFLTLARNNELTALKAGGISLYRVSLPVFLLAGGLSLISLAFQETLMPVLNQRGEEVDRVKIKHLQLPHLQARSQIWYRGSENRIYHISLLDPVNRAMSGVSIFELDREFSIRRRVDTQMARWQEQDGSWRFERGMTREFDPKGVERVRPFTAQTVRLPERFGDFAQIPKAPDVMNFVELRGYIQRLREGGHEVGKYLVDLYAKLAFPFAHLIMALVGIPFALRSPRGGRLIGVGLCILLGLSYWVAHAAAVSLARAGILPPILAAWAANILFATLGLFLFLRART